MRLEAFEKLLKEEFLDADKYKEKYVEMYKNPSNKEIREIMKDFQEKYLRGVVDPHGDLFVLSEEEMIHDDILKFLSRKKLIQSHDFWYVEPESLKKFLCVDKKDGWFLAESYSFTPNKKQLAQYKKFIDKYGLTRE